MTHAEQILRRLDAHLTSRVELTLYVRAALSLGFPEPSPEYALSRDVDAVLWLGQAEDLNENTNFWEAVENTNRELGDRDLYVSHFFVEDQVILLPDWRTNRIALPGTWSHLVLFRLGDVDLLLTKLMRDDPIDQADARFIVERAALSEAAIRAAIARARVPGAAEIREQFASAADRLLRSL